MDALIELTWRVYPSSAMLAAGAVLMSLGWRRILVGIRGLSVRSPETLITGVSGLRLFFIGFGIAGVGAAWAWHILWLFVLALVITGEETMEITAILYGLRLGRHRKPRTAAAAQPAARG